MRFNNFLIVFLLVGCFTSGLNAVSFTSPTPSNNSYLGTNSFTISLSFTSDENSSNLSAITYSIFNSSGVFNVSNNTATSLTFSGLADGVYTYNVTYYNSTSSNSSETRKVLIDTTKPSVSFNSPANNAFVSTPYLFVNVTGTDANYNTTTFNLFNSSGLVNSTNFTSNSTNFTNLPDGNYTYTVTVTDLSGNSNTTSTFTYVIDTTNPTASYNNPTLAANFVTNTTYIPIGLSVTEATLNQTTFTLFNSTSLVNSTNVSHGTSYNFTNLTDGNYTFNVTLYDSTGHSGTVASRNITILNTLPSTTSNSTVVNSSNVILFTWATNQVTNSTIWYSSISTSLTTSITDLTMLSSHSGSTVPLSCGTTYYYAITSCNLAGSCTTGVTYSVNTNACPVVSTAADQTTSTTNTTSTVTPTPIPTPTVTTNSSVTNASKTNTNVTEKIVINSIDNNTEINATTSKNKTVVAYSYVLPTNVSAGDLLKIEFTGLNCSDYDKGLLKFSIQPVSVSCGSIIAEFKAVNNLTKGEKFIVKLEFNKTISSQDLRQLNNSKVTIIPETSNNEVTGSQNSNDVSSGSSNLGIILAIIAVLAAALGYYLYSKNKSKKEVSEEKTNKNQTELEEKPKKKKN